MTVEAPQGYDDSSSSAVIAPRPLAVVNARGPDAASFLHGQLAADVEGLAVGDSCETLVLTPQGRIIAIGMLVRVADTDFVLVTDAPAAAPAAEALNRFKLRVDAEIVVGYDRAVHVIGPGAEEVASGAGRAVAYPGPIGGMIVLGDTDLGLQTASQAAFDARRIVAGEALLGVDVLEKTLPHEVGLVPRAVSLDKGCYTGQELVERIHSRGHTNRALRSVRIDADLVPEPGEDVVAGDKKIGSLTTTAHVPEWDAPGGLGLLRREAEPGSAVEVGGHGGVIVAATGT